MLKISGNSKYNPYAITFIVSVIYSCLAISTDNLINHDAIVFMDAAKAYLRDGAEASIQLHSWPFYSWLVAVVHSALWFSHIEQTAHFINIFFVSATCLLFIRIYAEITNDNGSLWVAAVIILAFTGINKYRADIMRDFGYWCCYLTAFLCLLKYYKSPNWRNAVGWQFFTLIAFLFRIEGVVIIALGPLALMLENRALKERIVRIIPLYGVYLIFFVGLIVALAGMDVSSIDMQLGRLPRLMEYLNIDGTIASYDKAVRKLGEIYWYEGEHLNKYYNSLALVYAVTLTSYVLFRVISCMGLPFFVFFAYGCFKRYIELSFYNRVIIYFALFLFLFLLIYVISAPVLSPRYTTSLVFMLLLLIGQIAERILPRMKSSKRGTRIIAVVLVYLFLNAADSVISSQGDSKTYILDAGYWVKANVDPSIPVYSNYYKALYYTDRGRSFRNSMGLDEIISSLDRGMFGKEACVIIKIEHGENQLYVAKLDNLVESGKMERIALFSNDKHDMAIVYRVISSGL